MALYAVGDLQGCLIPLQQLLEHVRFDPAADQLWLAGDLVNRGPDSIGCLRFVKALGESAHTVLGNHDLHLLACYYNNKRQDSDIANTLAAPDADELMAWLEKQPLLMHDADRKLVMTHAGLPPNWKVKAAKGYAEEVQNYLADVTTRKAFFADMYGNEPNPFTPDLSGLPRIRAIVNTLTRMRFCQADGTLEFAAKSSPNQAPEGFKPWFQWPVKRKHRVVFGHWAALMGRTGLRSVVGLDTGYVWGNHLTLMNMDTGLRYTCDTDGDILSFNELEFECL